VTEQFVFLRYIVNILVVLLQIYYFYKNYYHYIIISLLLGLRDVLLQHRQQNRMQELYLSLINLRCLIIGSFNVLC